MLLEEQATGIRLFDAKLQAYLAQVNEAARQKSDAGMSGHNSAKEP